MPHYRERDVSLYFMLNYLGGDLLWQSYILVMYVFGV